MGRDGIYIIDARWLAKPSRCSLRTEQLGFPEAKYELLGFTYMNLGLVLFAFDQSNAMLALSEIIKFSAKNITRCRVVFLLS